MKIIKALWVGVTVFVLAVTLYFFDGKPNSDIWIFLTSSMFILSFPASLVLSLVEMALGASVGFSTSYLSLTLAWAVFFVLGYFQWFRLVPYLIAKLRALRKKNGTGVKVGR